MGTTLPVAFLLIYDLMILLGAFGGKRRSNQNLLPLVLLFFCSGMPALIYQIVWQRALFAIYGVNSESVTVVVSAFMLGLGLGSLLGGWFSSRFHRHGIFIFALAELGTAAFGLVSLRLFHWAALHTAGAPLPYVVILSLTLLVVPTICMGATLPLLTEFVVRNERQVGYSVGVLYFANTFGSAVACYMCATFLLRDFGQSGAVRIAALMNLSVGMVALLLSRRRVVDPAPVDAVGTMDGPFLSLRTAAILSALTAFISLGFEIIWFRVFVLASQSRAPAFALLLATFLAGIAAGAFLAGKATEKRPAARVALDMSVALCVAGGLSPFLLPLVAFLKWKGLNYLFGCIGFFVVAMLLGAVFPLLCRLAISPCERAGRGVSLIYVANIGGSVAGSLFVGFVLMNHLGTRLIAGTLAASTTLIGLAVLLLVRRRTAGWSRPWLAFAGSVFASLVAQTLYGNFHQHLTFGPEADIAVAHVVENRNGTILVLANDAVFGDGVYDGYYNIEPTSDKNMIVRAYAVGGFHPSPKRVLMIGLSSGSWAQVLVNHPQTEVLDIVEINPGYLGLIEKYPAVSSILKNRKVRIVVDDGRRWLLAHPDQQYDLIVQNTSFFWRDHSAELLSTDYLRLIKSHLMSGGIYYYNTTGSDNVVATGLSVFPYGLRVLNFLALSESEIAIDKQRWMSVLRAYKIDGRAIFAPGQADAVMEKYAKLSDSVFLDRVPRDMEDGASMRRRIKDPLIFTDDNMGWEWR